MMFMCPVGTEGEQKRLFIREKRYGLLKQTISKMGACPVHIQQYVQLLVRVRPTALGSCSSKASQIPEV